VYDYYYNGVEDRSIDVFVPSIPEKTSNERKEKKGPKFRIPRPAGEIERADTARATRISHQQQQQQHGSTAAINNRRPRQTCVRQNGNDGKVFEPIQSLKRGTTM
jgi:hypothetical protein